MFEGQPNSLAPGDEGRGAGVHSRVVRLGGEGRPDGWEVCLRRCDAAWVKSEAKEVGEGEAPTVAGNEEGGGTGTEEEIKDKLELVTTEADVARPCCSSSWAESTTEPLDIT